VAWRHVTVKVIFRIKELAVIQETIARAKELRRADQLEESQDILLELLEENGGDPLVLFEVGGSYDVMGEEREAIPYYRQAIEAGLEGDDLQECLVCLGSIYRNIEEYEQAVAMLEQAVEQFPEKNSGRVFLALAYYSDGREDESVSMLLDLLLRTTDDEDILAYADALDIYKDHLDDVWEEDEE
jgi:tetratricopeptide (TPR) repeat protein